jgi:hypothetical protein
VAAETDTGSNGEDSNSIPEEGPPRQLICPVRDGRHALGEELIEHAVDQ